MATEAKTKTAEKAAVKKTAAKAPAEKAATSAAVSRSPKAAAGKKAETQKATAGKVKVTQLVGTIGRRHDQEATLIGLGLNKRHKSRVLEDTPSVRGMIYKVRHLLKVEAAN